MIAFLATGRKHLFGFRLGHPGSDVIVQNISLTECKSFYLLLRRQFFLAIFHGEENKGLKDDESRSRAKTLGSQLNDICVTDSTPD
jgi:hypothetical protein